MTFSNLPKSLIDSVAQIMNDSSMKHKELEQKLTNLALKKFNAKSIDSLSESDQKAVHAWVQIKLQESSCGCESNLPEDHMPNDDVLYKNGKMKGDLGEEEKADKDHDGDGEIESSEDEYLGSRDKAIKKAIASEENDSEPEEVSEDDEIELHENIAIAPDEVATNGAVGVRSAEDALPIHADVLRDSNPVDGTAELRLFVQWPTNVMPQIIPPPTLPGAPSLDALREICEGLPFYGDVLENALSSAADVPHERPENLGDK